MAAIDRLLDLLPDPILMRVERAYGATLARLADHRAGHRGVEAAHRLLGKAIGVIARSPAVAGGRGPEQVARRTMEKFFLPILEPLPAAAGGYAFEFTRCPYGLGPGTGALCHAIMNLEEEIVRSMGGELIIEARIAEGAPRCRFTVRG